MASVWDEFDSADKPASIWDDFDKAHPPRSLWKEVPIQTYAGLTVDFPKMVGQAIQWMAGDQPFGERGRELVDWAKRRETENPEFQPELEGRSLPGQALTLGARALAPSAATMVPAVVAAPLGGVAMAGAAAAGSFGLFGSSQAQETFENVKKAGGSEEDARRAGWINFLIEGGGETVGTIAGYKLLGVGAKALGKSPVDAAIKGATETAVLKPFLTQLPKTAAVEAGTEFGQNFGEAVVEQAYGVQDKSPWTEGAQGGLAALGMTALLAPFGITGFSMRARQNERVAQALTDPQAPEEQRTAAAAIVYDAIREENPEAARAWQQNATVAIAGKLPITLDESSATPARPTAADVMAAPTVEGAINAALRATGPVYESELGEFQGNPDGELISEALRGAAASTLREPGYEAMERQRQENIAAATARAEAARRFEDDREAALTGEARAARDAEIGGLINRAMQAEAAAVIPEGEPAGAVGLALQRARLPGESQRAYRARLAQLDTAVQPQEIGHDEDTATSRARRAAGDAGAAIETGRPAGGTDAAIAAGLAAEAPGAPGTGAADAASTGGTARAGADLGGNEAALGQYQEPQDVPAVQEGPTGTEAATNLPARRPLSTGELEDLFDEASAELAGQQPTTIDQPATNLPARRQQLFVERGGKRFEVASLEEASQKWNTFVDSTGAGASEIGEGARIVDQDGKEVARISYNGKVWPPGEWKPGVKPLVGEPFKSSLPPAGEPTTIDQAAHEAAISPQNALPEPSKEQILAGNAKLGHPKVAGMDVSVENPAGSIREDKHNTPPAWRTTMRSHYGYIRGTTGFDKDHLDAFVKPGTAEDWTGTVYVVNQIKQSGQFDEHKAMIGFGSQAEARAAYLENYEKGWESRIRSIAPMPLKIFKDWAYDKTAIGPKGGAVRGFGTPADEAPQAAPVGEPEKLSLPMLGRGKDWQGVNSGDIKLQQFDNGKWAYGLSLMTNVSGTGHSPSAARAVFDSREAALAEAVESGLRWASTDRNLASDSSTAAHAKHIAYIKKWLESLRGPAAPTETTGAGADVAPETKPKDDEKLDGVYWNRRQFEVSNNIKSVDQLTQVDKDWIIYQVHRLRQIVRAHAGDTVLVRGAGRGMDEAYVVFPREEYDTILWSRPVIVGGRPAGLSPADQMAVTEAIKKYTDKHGGQNTTTPAPRTAAEERENAQVYARMQLRKAIEKASEAGATHLSAQLEYLESRIGSGINPVAPSWVREHVIERLDKLIAKAKANPEERFELLLPPAKGLTPRQKADIEKEKAAKEKKAKQARRDAERWYFDTLKADGELMGVVTESTSETAAHETIKDRLRKVFAQQIQTELKAGDRDRAVALDKAFSKLKDSAEFQAAIRKAILKARKQAEIEANRNPEHYKAALAEAMGQDNIGEDAAMQTAYKVGWDHALAGKTKSTLTGDLINVVQHGYEAARKWIGTEIGRAWYEGKRGTKLVNTGVDLRRWFDDAKAKVEALKGEAGAAWKEIARLTERAELFRDLAGEGATPGTVRYLDNVRTYVKTFKEWLFSGNGPLNNLYWRRDNTLEQKIERFLKGEFDRGDKGQFDTDEKRRNALKAAADEYLETLRPLLDDLKGATGVADAAERFKKVMVASGTERTLSETGRTIDKIGGNSSHYYLLPESYEVKALIKNEASPDNVTRAQPLTPPRLDRVDRVGVKDHRKGRNVTPAEVKATFSFADIGFGTWVGSKQDQDHLNYAYDAFMDLADELNMPTTQIGLGGTLHLTIGALGHGKHAAHYSPDQPGPDGGTVRVINVTNTKGDGTVAHEWFHALDYHVGNGSPTSEGIANVVRALKVNYDLDYLDKKLEDFLVRGWYYRGDKNYKVGNAKRAMRHATNSGETSYLKAANELGADYWGNDRELFARAGEAWLFDRMGEKRNTYLVNPWVADGRTKRPTYRGTPYPEGEERKRFALNYEALLKSLDWTDKGPAFNAQRYANVAPDDKEKFDRKRAELEQNAQAIYDDLQKASERDKRAAEIAKRAAEEARKAEEAQAAAAALAASNPAPVGPLSTDELEDIFDEASAELTESTQEEPDAPTPGAEDQTAEQVANLLSGRGGRIETDAERTEREDREAIESMVDRAGWWESMDYGARQTIAEASDIGGMRRVVHRIAGSKWAELGPGEQASMIAVAERSEKKVEQTAGALAKEAAKLGVEGVDEALKGLVKLFGGGKIQSFPGGLDEDAYRQAKPHFEAALAKFQAAGKTLKDLFKFLIQHFGAGIKPYAVRFAKEQDLSAQLAAPASPSISLAKWVQARLERGETIGWQELFNEADRAWGGTQAQGKYTPKDAYDAVEAGVNLYLRKGNWAAVAKTVEDAQRDVANLERILEDIPTQTKRTAEMDEFQQFSTPPQYAYAVNWVANVRYGETVMEPSAGIGGLAIFADNAGAKLVLNELSTRRAAVLQALFPNARHFTEDAAQIDNVLPAEISPTLVVMNPPFSATAGRLQGARDTMEGARHIEQALRRLAPGGRLVAIVGEGMAADRPAFREWWRDIQKRYNVRANIGLDGRGYAKYGTTFDNQILVIDNDGATQAPIVTGKVQSVSEILPLLEAIRNERPSAVSQTATNDQADEQLGDQPGGQGSTAAGVSGPGETLRPAAGALAGDGGRGGRVPAGGGERAGDAGQTRPGRPAGSDGVPDDNGLGRPGADGRGPEGQGPGAGGALPAAGARGQDDRNRPVSGARVEQTEVEQAEFSNSIFEHYQPQRLKVEGAKPHPGALVQSAAMAAVLPPAPTYTPNLPKDVITKGMLSLAQIETVVYAGQAHQEFLPGNLYGSAIAEPKTGTSSGSVRRGFMIGDGTGVGKGREIGGIILDNFRQGRTKAIWMSEKQGLIEDAKRDFAGVSGKPDLIFNQNKTKPNDRIQAKTGVLFTTYSTLRNGVKKQPNETDKAKAKSRVEQLVEWVGPDFDGVLVFDESHNMGNAIPIKGKRGMTKPSAQALAGVELQRQLPKARVVYVSATAATEVSNLTYAGRIGLWGEGTAFAALTDFVNKVTAAGVSAMELVARDMKAMGAYIARSLSYDGVKYERVVHELTGLQRDAYNVMVQAWQKVLANIGAALEETGQEKNGNAKGAALAQFWGAHQRFFNQLITAMQMPSVIASARTDIDAGHSVVMQLVNTNEAEQERQAAERKRKQMAGELSEEEEEDFEFGPMDGLINYVRTSYPVQQYEEYEDEDGNKQSRPVVDAAGNPVFSKEAIRMREALVKDLEEIAKSQAIPGNPIDLLVEAFGNDTVAEVTGRKRRFVREKSDDGGYKVVEQKRGKHAAAADASLFLADKKRVLIFSDAGGTGYSFHADNTKKNTRLRRHYLVQPGWRADKAVQGFGRTHRTNQKQPPEYVLVTTDLKAQKRFISSIARRLDQLGALTKGERKTGSQGLFTAADNLESGYAKTALRNLLKDLYADRVPGMSFASLMDEMGLNLIDPKTGALSESKLPDIPQFLNRLLSLQIDTQSQLFDAFGQRMDELVQAAIDAGTFDDGMQTLHAQKIRKVSEEPVHEDPRSGAVTKYVDLELTHPTQLNEWQDVQTRAEAAGADFSGYYRDNRSDAVFMVVRRGRRVDGNGVEYVKGERWDVSGRRRYIDNVLHIEDKDQQKIKKKVQGEIYDDSSSEAKDLSESYEVPGQGYKRQLYAYEFAKQLEKHDRAWMEEEVNKDYETDSKGARKAAAQRLWKAMQRFIVPGEVERRMDHYTKLTEADAEREWRAQLEAAPKTYTDHTHLISGVILPIWDRFPEGQTQVARAQTDTGEKFLGRVVPPKDLKKTLRNLGVNAVKSLSADQIIGRIKKGDAAILSNGWVISQVRVSGSKRIEITSHSSMTTSEERLLVEMGAFSERIGWKTRFFIPDGEDELRVFGRITASKPVVEIEGDDSAADTAFSRGTDYRRSPARYSIYNTAAVRRIVHPILQQWGNAPKVEVVASMEDPRVPESVRRNNARQRLAGAEGEPEAFLHNGTIYLVANALSSETGIVRALFHEALGHYGLRGTLGDRFVTVLNEVERSMPDRVKAKAREYGLDWNDRDERQQAAEEVLAEIAQERPHAGIVQRAIATIRWFLRELGVRLKLSENDIINDFILPARRFVTDFRVGQGWTGGRASFSRAPDQTKTDDIRFSRAPSIAGGQTLGDWRDSLAAGAWSFLRDLMHSDAKIGWWGRTIGTQQHKAITNREFRPVYNETQAFIADTSKYANEAADLATDILPRIEQFRDFWKKTPKDADLKAAVDALYAGTLFGGGSPMDGRVWTDAELKSGRAEGIGSGLPMFTPLTDRQIKHYRDSLAAVGKSTDELAKSIIHKLLRPHGLGIDREMGLEDAVAIAHGAIDEEIENRHLAMEASDEARAIRLKAEIEELQDLKASIADIEAKAAGMKEHGYFPAMRFGKYAVHVVEPAADGSAEQLYFGMYESQTAANLAARQLEKELRPDHPDMAIERGIMSQEQFRLFQGLNLDALETFAQYITDESGQPIARDPLVQGFLKAAVSERSILKRHIHRKGISGFSEDLPRSLASFVVSSARATSSNYHTAEMLRLANAIGAGDVKDEAIKLVRYLQDPQEEAHGIRAFLFTQFLGGSIAHGLVNMTQPFMVTIPYLSQYTSAADAAAKVGQAAAVKPEALTGAIKEAYERAKKEGVVAPQEIHQLRAETGGMPLGRSLALRKLSFLWGSIYSVTEQFNRATSFLAAYRIAEEKGMDNPYAFARQAVEETQFVYNKGNRPNWARGPVGATVFTFKQFSISYLELAKRIYGKDKKAFALMVLMLLAAAGLEGLPFAEDIEDLIDSIGQWMGYATNSKKKLRRWATAVLGADLAQVALRGISGLPWMPVDVSVRMGLQNLIPGTSMMKPSEKNKARDVVELVGPVGQFIPTEGTMAGRALDRLAASDWFGAVKAAAPVAVQNIAKGSEMLARGEARDLKGKKITPVSPAEAVFKMAGLNPASVARESRKIGEVAQDVSLQRTTESEIAEQWARGRVDNDPEAVRAAMKKLHDWNATNPELRIRVTQDQIRRSVKEMRMPREQRFIKSAPREIRAGVREALRQ